MVANIVDCKGKINTEIYLSNYVKCLYMLFFINDVCMFDCAFVSDVRCQAWLNLKSLFVLKYYVKYFMLNTYLKFEGVLQNK